MKIIIAGDFAPRARLAKQIEEKKFSEVFPDQLTNIIKKADFSFVNFESPIVEDGVKSISKCGPNLRCTSEAAEAVKYAGFTGVTMANNHILDYGIEGLNKTIACCKSIGLDIVGVGDNLLEAGNILYLNKDDKTLAIINCCEHEFSIATNESPGANPLNPIHQFYSIKEARTKADYVIVIIHGGHEFCPLPSPRMQETYRFFVDAGADAVVNHHQHCYSGYETYKGKFIFYGIGNFCFDINPNRVNTAWNYGYLLELRLGDQIDFTIYPYNQYSKKPCIELLDNNSFESCLNEYNMIISDRIKLKSRIDDYYQKCQKYEYALLEPYSGRFFSKLFSLGLLPRFIRGEKLYAILNHIDCEAHRDKLIYALKKK